MRRSILIARWSVLALAVVALAAEGARAAVTCASAPAAVRSITGHYDVFVLGSDKHVHQALFDGKTWRWVDLGGTCYQGVAATRSTAGRINLFSVDKDGNLIQRIYDRDWAKEWTNLGRPSAGKCASAPAAVLSTAGRPNVFVLGDDRQVHQAAFDGSEWKWSTVGGTASFGAAATARLGKLDVFTVDKGGNLIRNTWDRNWGKDWENLGTPPGAKCASAPAALVSNRGHYNVFVLGTDKQAHTRVYDGKEWKWAPLGGMCQYGFAATDSGTGRVDLFGVDKDGNLIQRIYNKDWAKEWVNLKMPAP
jgi:hypothetical protein